MPRAFCPECAAEVPVDEQGRCFLGHEVPAGASPRPDPTDATEEPEPWVANVTAEGAETPGTEAGTRGPEPSPGAPTGAGGGEEEEVELDLDTLEQAVAEMGITAEDDEDDEDEDTFAIFDERTPGPPTDAAARPPQRPVAEEPEPEEPAQPEVEVHEDTVADVLGTQEAAPEPTPEPSTEPQPPAGEPEPDEWAAFDEPTQAQEPTELEEEPEPDEEPEPVDTANFLARPKGKRRGLFGR